MLSVPEGRFRDASILSIVKNVPSFLELSHDFSLDLIKRLEDFYEIFKDVYKAALGPKAAEYQTIGFLVSSACAEVIADVLFCPWEAVSTFLLKLI